VGDSYVYVTTAVQDPVGIGANSVGPTPLSVSVLQRTVGSHASGVKAIDIPRSQAAGYYVLDVPLTITDVYVASLQVMLRGHGIGSMIWWRWRTADQRIGDWFTDYDPHSVRFSRGYVDYTFVVTGQAYPFGYDDVAISLSSS
jgi:hypothetical protein